MNYENLLSSLEGEFVILFSVLFCQLGVVKSLENIITTIEYSSKTDHHPSAPSPILTFAKAKNLFKITTEAINCYQEDGVSLWGRSGESGHSTGGKPLHFTNIIILRS